MTLAAPGAKSDVWIALLSDASCMVHRAYRVNILFVDIIRRITCK